MESERQRIGEVLRNVQLQILLELFFSYDGYQLQFSGDAQ
jgi:hypothetical protein